MLRVLTIFSRIFVGVLFIISGLIKANDPLGFSYKLDEYFIVFHTEWASGFSLLMAMVICAFEIGLGFALLLGARVKATLWLLLALIVFFTFLTFYSAYYNKVTDCGCFGDALKLTPWQSFTKDVVLLVFILVLLAGKKFIKPLMKEKITGFFALAGFAASMMFSIYAYMHLPVIDFRPYKAGTDILEGMTLPPGAVKDSVQMVFVYQKDGKKMEFTPEQAGELDSTYEYVDRLDKLIRKGDEPKIHDFVMNDADGQDIASDWLKTNGYKFILVAYDLSKTNLKVQDQITAFAAKCDKESIPFVGLTASSAALTDSLRHAVQAGYPYYFCDATALKTIIRSNPGLVLLKDAKVLANWHHNDFPEFRDVKAKYLK